MRTSYFIYCLVIYVAIPNIALSQTLSGFFNLVNKNSNLCLAVRNASNLPGEETYQWNADGTTDKAWELIFLGGSTYKVKNAKSQLFLGLRNPAQFNGEKVTQRVEHSGDPQELNWIFIHAGNGYYKIQNRYSRLYLAVEGSSFERGRPIIQWADLGQDDLLWRLVPANLPYPNQVSPTHNPYLTSRGGSTSTVSLPTRSYNFPGGGIKNSNQYIGDFFGTGETAAVLDNSNACVGYVYFFNSRNPSYNAPGGMVMSDLEILLSGAREFGKPQVIREKGSIYFASGQVYVGAQMVATVGRVLYTVKILDLKFEVINGRNTGRFYTNSVKLSVIAQAAY